MLVNHQKIYLLCNVPLEVLVKHTSKHTLVFNDDISTDQIMLSSRSSVHFIIEKKWKFKVILPCRRLHPHLGRREGDTQQGTEKER